jgi:CRISPR/Cas system CSM-associated protein Csm4 (group 5 of RAMP superfamily)
MLCRNRIADFAKWKTVFDSHAQAHRDAALKLEHVWRSMEDPNNVFFVFQVLDINLARAFIQTPDAEEAGKASGVIDGEYHFVEDSALY